MTEVYKDHSNYSLSYLIQTLRCLMNYSLGLNKDAIPKIHTSPSQEQLLNPTHNTSESTTSTELSTNPNQPLVKKF